MSEDDRSRKRALRRYALLEARDRMQAVGMSPEMARDMLTQLEQYLIGMDARIETPDKPKTPADDTSLSFLNDLATPGNTTLPG